MTDQARRCGSADGIHPIVRFALDSLSERKGLASDGALKLDLIQMLLRITDVIIGGSAILPAPQQLIETVRITNRVVSFVLDDKTHFGTGILVGPSHVLTAGHLFFESNGTLIDRARLSRITISADTTFLGNIVVQGSRRSTALYKPESAGCFIDPEIDTPREMEKLDFAIVRIVDALGDDPVGNNEERGFFEIPAAAKAPVLSPDRPIRVFQYLDAKEVRISSGVLRDLSPDETRVAHTASTLDGASGAPLVEDDGQLLGIHVSGALSGVAPRSNYALPMARIATSIDTPNPKGITARQRLKA